MLTDAHCRAAKPKEQLYRLNDFRSLYLEVKPNGVKTWRYRSKLGGKGSWFALGDYPAVSLAEAQDKCEEARKLVKQVSRKLGAIQSSRRSSQTSLSWPSAYVTTLSLPSLGDGGMPWPAVLPAGPAGIGKTGAARWLANQLPLPFRVFDMVSTQSGSPLAGSESF